MSYLLKRYRWIELFCMILINKSINLCQSLDSTNYIAITKSEAYTLLRPCQRKPACCDLEAQVLHYALYYDGHFCQIITKSNHND